MAAFKTYLQQNIWVESSSFLYFSPFLLFSFDEVWFLVGRGSSEGAESAETVLDAWGKSEKNEMNFSKEISMGSLQALHILEAHILKRNLS